MIPVLSAAGIEVPNQINAGNGSFGEKSDRTPNPSTIVFIDAAVADYETLLYQVKLGVEAIVIDSHRDGVEQISEVLANRTNIDSIHLVSHGEPGSLQLGKTPLSVDNLEAYGEQLQQWRRALTIDADILIYGCNVAASRACQKVRQEINSLSQRESRLKTTKNNFIKQSSLENFCYERGVETNGGLDEPAVEGIHFLHRIASLTGANIAASKYLTGSAKLGGNWELEENIGNIKSPLAFESNAMQNYASVLATYSVTNTFDSGPDSLRDAIEKANSNPGLDTIDFEIPGPGPHSITLGQALPVITSPVIIDGQSQPGYTNKPIIELNGTFVAQPASNAGNYINGLELGKSLLGGAEDSSGSTIQGLAVNRFGKGGNFPGNGILVQSNNNTIQDNFLGTDVSGTTAVGNTLSGIRIQNTQNTTPNVTTVTDNIISGNGVAGIFVAGAAATDTKITANFIGTDPTGMMPLGNEGDGILILDQDSSNNIIGGTAAGDRNIIANNKRSGIEIKASSGSYTIQRNSIFNNKRLGIDLIGNTGVTSNDVGDADTGTNNLQNYPVLTSVTGNTVSGILNSTPNASFRVEFFANTSYDPAGAGQGQTFIGFKDVVTDSAGNANINFAYTPVAGKPVLAATATNKTTGGTSEFSRRNQSPINSIPGRTTSTTTNPNNITLNSGNFVYNVLATPYPSPINVSGVTGKVDSVTITLNNVNTSNSANGGSQNINLLLVGPEGQNVVLMSQVPSAPLNNVTLKLDDNAASFLSSFPVGPVPPTIASGTYKPTNYSLNGFLDVYPFVYNNNTPTPTGAPEGPYGSTLSVFNKTNPNGTWKLYAVDANQENSNASNATNAGKIGSWSVDISTDLGKEATTQNTPRIFSASNGNSISVSDSDSESVQVNLSVTSGTLKLSSLTGITGSGNGSNSLVYTGKKADINAALQGLIYTPNPNFVGTDTLTLTTNDLGSPVLGGAQTDSDRVDITVNPITPPTPPTPTPTPPTPPPAPTPPTPTPTPTPPTPTATPSETPTPTPAETPTPTPTPSETPTPAETPTPPSTPKPTPPSTPTPTPSETPTPIPSETPTPTSTPTPTPGETPTPTPAPSSTPTPASTPTPSVPVVTPGSDTDCICHTIEYPTLDRPNQADNNINGNGSGAIVFGTPENDAFYGSPNSTIFDADLGDDNLYGGEGRDIFYGNRNNDFIDGNKGDDILFGGKNNDIILGAEGDDTIFGNRGKDSINGKEDNDLILGCEDADFIDGGKGSDIAFGGKGNDIIFGSQGEDFLYGDYGNDSLCGGAGNDCLSGGAGSDWLGGCEGNDTLIGGKGNDTLMGSLGEDSLIGSTGLDRFLLSANSGIDIIADFEAGKDLLMLANGLTFEQLTITENSGATLIQFGETGEIIAALNGVSAIGISASDFSFI